MNKKVLLVDDEEIVREPIKKALIGSNYDVVEACNGAECLAIAEKELPDIILLDLAMPGLDGLSVLKQLREKNEWGANVPVILLTSLQPDDTVNEYINQTHPAYYLLKSQTTTSEIIEHVKKVLIHRVV